MDTMNTSTAASCNCKETSIDSVQHSPRGRIILEKPQRNQENKLSNYEKNMEDYLEKFKRLLRASEY